jgi:hypothetical protein
MWRVLATYFSFFIFGMNDGAYGVSFTLASHFYHSILTQLPGVNTLCMSLSIFSPPHILIVLAARRILPSQIHSRLLGLPLSFRRLHTRFSSQQCCACQVRTARSRNRWDGMSPCHLHCLCISPSIPSAGCSLCCRGFREWSYRCSLVCLDWEHDEREPDYGVSAGFVCFGSYGLPSHCYSYDYQGQAGIV